MTTLKDLRKGAFSEWNGRHEELFRDAETWDQLSIYKERFVARTKGSCLHIEAGSVGASVQQLRRVMFTDLCALSPLWHKLPVEETHVVEADDDDSSKIVYIRYSTPQVFAAPREFIYGIVLKELGDGDFSLSCRTIDHEQDIAPGAVRGEFDVAYRVIAHSEDPSRAHYEYLQTSIKANGWVPNFLLSHKGQADIQYFELERVEDMIKEKSI